MITLALCDRINRNCENKRTTIFDTNFFINYLNCITENIKRPYREVLKDFKIFIANLYECSNQKIYCSNQVFNEEYRRTISEKVPYLSVLARQYQMDFVNLIKNSLNIKTINNNLIEPIEEISNMFLNQKGISKIVEINDLTLLIAALEILKERILANGLLFVTDDTSLYALINHINEENRIDLNGEVFNNLHIIPITALSYMTKVFKCCKFDNLEGFGRFFFMNNIKINNPKMRETKLTPFYSWSTNEYYNARTEKEKMEGG